MATLRPILFMNQDKEVREWFLREPSLSRARELGFEVRANERDEALTEAEWADAIGDAEALLTTWGSPRLTEAVLARNSSLKIVAHVGGTVVPQVSPALYERGVRVTTANPLMARTVAETGLMLMLMGLRNAHRNVQLGNRSVGLPWSSPKDNIRTAEACVIGLWGFGDIARWLLAYLRPFTPKEILVSSEHLPSEVARQLGVRTVEFDALFEQADVIFVLAGMTRANFGRIGPRQLEAMKNNAVLINLGRAPLIQREPLLCELEKDRFTGIFDVFYADVPPDKDPLARLPNVILTPHIAGTGRDALYLGAMLEEVDRFFKGEPLLYEVSESRSRTMTDPSAMEACPTH